MIDNVNPKVIAVAGDWHGNTGWARRAIEYAVNSGASAIVHLGDFGYWRDNQHDNEYLKKTQAVLAKNGVMLYWVDGNHEDHSRIALRLECSAGAPWSEPWAPNIVHLPRGYRWTWQGLTMMALGGAVSLDKTYRTEGRDWWPGEAITAADVRHATRPGDVHVVFAHDKPHGVTVPGLSDDWPQGALYASDLNQNSVRHVLDTVRPAVLFHGHLHRRHVTMLDSTKVVGLDCDGSSMSANIEIVTLGKHNQSGD